jgi:hypothetical protein
MAEPIATWWRTQRVACGVDNAWRISNGVRKLAAEARDYVLRERTIEKNIWRWREACAAPATRELAAAGGPP